MLIRQGRNAATVCVGSGTSPQCGLFFVFNDSKMIGYSAVTNQPVLCPVPEFVFARRGIGCSKGARRAGFEQPFPRTPGGSSSIFLCVFVSPLQGDYCWRNRPFPGLRYRSTPGCNLLALSGLKPSYYQAFSNVPNVNIF